MIPEMTMPDLVRECTNLLNTLGDFHSPGVDTTRDSAVCLAFVLDHRCVEKDGVKMKVGASVGANPALPGTFVFGIHVVEISGNQVAMFDQRINARETAGCEAVECAVEIARAILAEMSDREIATSFARHQAMRDDSQRWALYEGGLGS